ncbi:MAG: Gfo/Idh/MocA family oxidoreductase [Actinomycetota bacterium]
MVGVVVGGAGAFGRKHLDALRNIDDAEVIGIVDPQTDLAAEAAEMFGVDRTFAELDEALGLDEVEAVILTSPTPMHAAQAIQCMDAGKHVEVEIPAADTWADSQAVLAKQQETGLVCQVGHTRRYNPSHQWVKQRIDAGDYTIQHMDVQTFFFRRTNTNALGLPRTWTDHLLWHHSAHTIDLFQYMTGERVVASNVMQGPEHPELGIAMDMSIQLKTESGILCTLALSFNNDGPLGTFFRYIGDTGTYIARYDDLVDGRDEAIDVSQVDVSMNGIELQDRDFLAAVQGGPEPRASIANVFPCYEVIADLEHQLETSEPS